MAFPTQEASQRQVQRVLQSSAFRNAHTLQQLLQFLVAQAYSTDREKLKEYTIGVEAFSRPQDFDPKTDPIVRVQTHRLRQKLKEYYETDGRHDPILIDIPKGHYLPTLGDLVPPAHKNGAPPLLAGMGASNADATACYDLETRSPRNPGFFRRLFSRRNLIAAAAAAALFTAGLLIGNREFHLATRRVTASASSEMSFNPGTEPVKAFWASLLGNDPTPIIAHADAVFLLDSHNDLFSFPYGATEYRGSLVNPHVAGQFASNPALVAKAGKLYYEDSYLGAGDLDAVAILSNLFGQMGLKPIIEPGRELTPEDFKQHNVILVGSSFQSFAESQFNTVGDFTFVDPNPHMGDWNGIIVNAHPRPGEQAIYRTERDPVTQVLKTDHALITVQPGVVSGRYIVDLGGLDTTGCAGAAMFSTSVDGLEKLKGALAAQRIHGTDGGPPLFQALLSVRLEKGNEVLENSLLTVSPLFPEHEGPQAAKGTKSSPSK